MAFDSDAQAEAQGLTVSFPHLVMEMILGTGGEVLEEQFLPSPDLVLRRLPDFARRVGALGLTQEGMAVLAKINDHRTAREIADPSPHGRDMALRLLAAAVGAGIAEAAPRVAEVTFATPLAVEPPPRRRRRWWPWVVAALVVIVAVAALLLAVPGREAAVAVQGGPWGLGHRRRLPAGRARAALPQAGAGQGQPARGAVRPGLRAGASTLVWGGFATREAAQAAQAQVPSTLVARAFVVHAVHAEQRSP
ncbi:MAG: hypothetical protein AB2L07_13020 [Thermoanaerobaculaceae bacterium]